MAIINNNVQNIQFLRNQTIFLDKAAAVSALNTNKSLALDGTALLARYYGEDDEIKTLVGFVYLSGSTNTITIIDVEGSEADVETLREEINAKLGDGITSANTATSQLTALSGTSADGSGVTSVWGAKAYAKDYTDEQISSLDGNVTAADGSYVKTVTEVDGKISGTTAELPTVAAITVEGKPIIAVAEDKGTISASAGTIDAQYVDVTGFTATNVQGALEEVNANIGTAISGLDYTDTAEAKKFVTAVSEENGVISVTRGEVTSTDKTVVLTDGNDGGINLAVNIDNSTLQKDANGVISVTSSALVQYEGDDDTIQISAVSQGIRTVSSPLTIQKVTTGLSANIKEEYHLVGHSGTTIGAPVQIYKDSSLLSVALLHADLDSDPQLKPTYTKADGWTDIAETAQTEDNLALCFAYENASGEIIVEAVPVGDFLREAEFASGVTVTNGIAHGVVDPQSESFLTVGEGGFKLSGVQDAIDAAVGTAVSGLDATVTAETTHVSVQIDEADGKLTAVTLNESDIASAAALAALSGKAVTEIESSNASISAVTATTTDGTVKVDVTTDADKIKMSGFTTTTGNVLSNVTEDSTVTDAVEAIDTALTSIDGRVDTIESDFVSAATVNGSGATITDNTIALSVQSAAASGTETSPITVTTNEGGGIVLSILGIDAGFYDGEEQQGE